MRLPFRLPFQQHRLVGGALVLAATQFAASIAGLVRDRTLTATFPDLQVVDAYIAAFRPSDLLFQVTIMAGFSVALVPLLAGHHGRGDSKEMGRLLGGVLGLAACVFGAVALVLAVFFPQVARYSVQFTGETFDLYVTFGRLALLTNFLFVFGNAFGQYLITVQRYWIYGLTPVLYTLGTILGTMFLSGSEAFGPLGPMAGSVIGAVAYVLLRAIAVLKHGGFFRLGLWHPDLAELGWLMLPRMLALGALQFQLLLFDAVASGLSAGSVTINAYARNFQSVVVGVVGIALAQSAFSLMSQSIARREEQRFWVYLRKGTFVMLGLTIPGAIVLTALAPIAARLVHLSDRLDVFWVCLGLYAVSIPFESMNHLLLRAFYSLKSSVKPAVFSVCSGLIAVGASWFLAPHYGVYALALGFSAGQVFQMIGLGLFLPSEVRTALQTGPWFGKLIKKFVPGKPLPEEQTLEQ